MMQGSTILFRDLFDHHTAVVLIVDPGSGNIVEANRAAERYYGWPKEQLRQTRIQDITVPLSAKDNQEEIDDVLNLQQARFHGRHRRADGSIRDIEALGGAIAVEGNTLRLVVIHDITESRQDAKLLEECDIKYRDLFDNAPIGIFSVTSEGQILSINASMAEILGFDSPQEAIDHYSAEPQEIFFITPELRDYLLPVLQERGSMENFEYQIRTVTNLPVWLRTNARITQRNRDGSFIIEGFSTDITAQRELENQLHQAQKMESIGRLAGGVAHDFNNMIGVISGYTAMAMESVTPSMIVHDYLQEVLTAANRSTEIIRQLLAFARKQIISPRVIDLNDTIKGMLKMLRRLLGEDVELTWVPKASLWPVKMDPSQLDQILANLCVNARDAISDVGKITIETDMVVIDETYCTDHAGFIPGSFVLLVVSDDGCGIDKGIRDKIFEPFFTTKGLGRGSGLGLAMVYGIVKQNEGFINVYSEPGRGTTFKIYLPRHEGSNIDSPVKRAVKHPVGHGETILIVEDEAAILKLGKTILERLGYKVLDANTAAGAIRLAEIHNGEIDLLIVDVVLPGMNGRDLSDRLQALYPKAKTLFMSGYTADVIAHRGVLDKGLWFLQKPFSREDLAIKVHEALK